MMVGALERARVSRVLGIRKRLVGLEPPSTREQHGGREQAQRGEGRVGVDAATVVGGAQAPAGVHAERGAIVVRERRMMGTELALDPRPDLLDRETRQVSG